MKALDAKPGESSSSDADGNRMPDALRYFPERSLDGEASRGSRCRAGVGVAPGCIDVEIERGGSCRGESSPLGPVACVDGILLGVVGQPAFVDGSSGGKRSEVRVSVQGD